MDHILKFAKLYLFFTWLSNAADTETYLADFRVHIPLKLTTQVTGSQELHTFVEHLKQEGLHNYNRDKICNNHWGVDKTCIILDTNISKRGEKWLNYNKKRFIQMNLRIEIN